MDEMNLLQQTLEDTGLPMHSGSGLEGPPPDYEFGDDEVLDLGSNFDFDGFQVVRREFFAHIRVPSITFNNYKFAVNTACINRFPNSDYVQVLVNRETKILALRPCDETARDAYAWSGYTKGKRKPRPITGRIFFAQVMAMMDWDYNCRYKILGRPIHANGEYMLAFDLTSHETYQKKQDEDGNLRASRTPIYPAEWKNQFGVPYNEHKKSTQISVFDGYAIFAVKDRPSIPSSPSEAPVQETGGATNG